MCFSFRTSPPTHIYTLSLHDALPISYPFHPADGSNARCSKSGSRQRTHRSVFERTCILSGSAVPTGNDTRCDPLSSRRSEEHTSELQSHSDLVCRLLLEKNKPHSNQR